MLLNIRESFKGTVVAGVVLVIFIVPLVLTGVGPTFLGSAAGTDAATVDGKTITERDLARAVETRRNALLQQDGADENADYLKRENLREPVLDSLIRAAAIIAAAEDGGMGIPQEVVIQQIRQIEQFWTDGKFDQDLYRRVLASSSFNPSSFRKYMAETMLASQHASGIELSSFNTENEIDNLVALLQQSRSFYTLTLSKSKVEENVTLSEEEIVAFYQENKNDYVEPEKMSVKYVSLSIPELAKMITVDENQVRSQYELEIAQLDNSAEFEIAHILLEGADGQTQEVKEVAQKLSEGEEFEALVAEYSDDIGSKDSGGNLGVLTPGIFPEVFENAVLSLEEGEVSEPVKTDAGIHFIKVISKNVEVPPTYEERKDAIAQSISMAEAEIIYVEEKERLADLTFSADKLEGAAEALGREVLTTEMFSRASGEGIATHKDIRDAAFSEDVLVKGYNSPVIELPDGQTSYVIRKEKHAPARVKDLEEVRDLIVARLTKQKIASQLEMLAESAKERLEAGESAEAIAEDEGYVFESYDNVTQASSDAGFDVSRKAFAMTLDEEADMNFDFVEMRDGDYAVIGLQSVQLGDTETMEPQQLESLKEQLKQQLAQAETVSYEDQILKTADIDIK